MPDLSICIPSYNRAHHLNNCLNSLKLASKNNELSLEVCVSDNCSEDDLNPIIDNYKKDLNLIYNRNKKNIGMGKNILKAVSMASGEFCWLIGNDDVILPETFNKLSKLIKTNKNVDFFYVNSYHLNFKDIKNLNYPFNPRNINFSNSKKFSNYKHSKKLKFFDLIDPEKSFEFMLSFFLCVFRRRYWNENLDVIDEDKISDTELYSNFDNTAPHTKIWSRGFKDKMAYFISEPFTANLHGPRSDDWGNLYPFVEGVRIPQVLDNYRKDGLPFFQYILCKNFALRRLIPSFFYMIKNRKNSNFKYTNLKKDFFYNLIYPMVYISLITLILKRITKFIKN